MIKKFFRGEFKNFLRRKGAVKVLFASILVFPASTACVLAGEQNPRAHIEIFPEKSRGPVSPYIFGAGIDAKTNPMRFPAYPDKLAEDIKESGLRAARYPGGFVFARGAPRHSWANFYWQDHIGKNPEEKPFYTYDLDTFVQMCERFGIEPLMQINFVGEPQESVRGYIEYLIGDGDIDGDGINWAAKRAEHGREKPYNIRYWQLGNEVHDHQQGFPMNAQGAREYAEAVNELVPVIRRMAPDSKIVLPLINVERPRSGMQSAASPERPDINFATSGEFAVSFLEHLTVDVDYFDWHFYPANGWNGSYPFLGTEEEWKHYYCWGTKFRECYDVVVNLIKEHYHNPDSLPRIIVGEWSGDFTGCKFPLKENSYRGSMMRTMASAVYMADILMFMLEKSIPSEHMHAAFWHNFANGAQGFFSIHVADEYEQVLGRPKWCYGAIEEGEKGRREPVYWAFKLLSEQHGDELVKSFIHSDNNLIEAPANGLYWDPEFHFERVTHLATRRDNTLYLALLNKDANLSVDLLIDIRGWEVEASAGKYAVGADSYLAGNSLEAPDNIALSEENIAVDPSNMKILLPPNTLTVLRFTKNDAR